jgi:outer membrane protein assembly factor BamA
MRRGWSVLLILSLGLAATACKEEGTIKVKSLSFNGVKSVDESRLKNALATRSSSKLPWGKKNYFDRTRFDADLKRIQAFYADRGFPDARVTGFDVRLNDKQDAVDVTITIAEGDPVKVAAINFSGFDVIPPDHLKDLQKRVPLKVGQPRDRQLVIATHEMALNELRDHGYPYAKLGTNEDDGADGKTASLTFTAEPGKIAYFGPVEITGNKSVSEHVIRRELAYKPGDLYRRSLIQDTQRRLYRMELFQFATVQPITGEQQQQQPAADGQTPAAQPPAPNPAQIPEAQQPTEVPTRITVAEGSHHRLNFGVGYGTEEKARVDGEYHHLNFLGGARSAGVHARYSSLDRGLRVDLNQPYLFRPHFSMALEGQQWRTYTPAYNSVITGGKATVVHRADSNTSWSVSYTSEHDSSAIAPRVLSDLKLRTDLIALGLDPTKLTQTGQLNAAGFDFQHSTADNLLNAHHGYQLAFHTEEAGKLLPGTYNYFAMSADGRHYLPIGEKLVFANRVQVGNITPRSGENRFVPFAKKYFLGGATSIRGWGRFEVSPLSGSGLPLGGNSMFAFTSELRAMLRGNLGGVLFLDGGNVWDKWANVRLGDLRYAIGPGLRYQTPVGPIRFDFGYQLNPIPGLIVNGQPEARRWRIHFSIGQAF